MELVMPINYEVLEQEEMQYLDGGWSAYTVAKNLTNLAAMGIAGAMLAKTGKIMWGVARQGISLAGAVAKVGYAAKTVFLLLPTWAKVAAGVAVTGTIRDLGTWTF